MFLKELHNLIKTAMIQAGTAFNQQKQLVRVFSDAKKRPQSVRKFTDRPRFIPGAVFLFWSSD